MRVNECMYVAYFKKKNTNHIFPEAQSDISILLFPKRSMKENFSHLIRYERAWYENLMMRHSLWF